MVKTRPLGTTGYHVSEIGFGGWGLGADQWRGFDEAQGRDALREAVDQGITFFDTALAYGNGHSERLIGRVLRNEIHAGRIAVGQQRQEHGCHKELVHAVVQAQTPRIQVSVMFLDAHVGAGKECRGETDECGERN